MIHDIWRSGMNVKKVIVSWFKGEDAAFAFEKSEIGRIGIENLTNLSKGGESEATKAIARGKQFIRNLEARMHTLDESKSIMAMNLILEMKENISRIQSGIRS